MKCAKVVVDATHVGVIFEENSQREYYVELSSFFCSNSM